MSENEQANEIVDGSQFADLDRHAEIKRDADSRSEIIEAVPTIFMRGVLYLFVAVVFICIAIAIIAEVHVVVKASGSIIPEGQNMFVEAQESGVVQTIHVSPGEQLKKGQILLTLQRNQSKVDLASLERKLILETERKVNLEKSNKIIRSVVGNPEILIKREISEFINAGTALTQINAVRASRQVLDRAKEEFKIFLEKQKKLGKSQIAVARDSENRLQKNLAIQRQSLKGRTESLKSKQDELAQVRALAERRIVPQSQVSSARDAVISAESQLNSQRQQISQTELEISKTRLRVSNLGSELNQQETLKRDSLSKAQLSYDQLLATLSNSIAENMRALNASNAEIRNFENNIVLQKGQIQKLTIISPIDGMLTQLNFPSVGMTVGKGARVGTIIPKDANPIVQVRVKNKDIAFVKVGTPARVKIDAYPFRQFGTVPAHVERVYPVPDKQEFAVRLVLEKLTINVRERKVPLEPGLTVNVDLLTEKRRLIQLLFKKTN